MKTKTNSWLVQLLAVTLLYCTASAGVVFADEKITIVFDASGSMWQQVDDRNRLSIAKEAVDQLLVDIPATVDVGMAVYGHRRKGDCNDIEVLPESLDRGQLRKRLKGVTAQGKTPLGASIERVANQLAQTDTRARVIALTDGLETCGYDLCELANTLKATGVGLIVDVVAFELTGDDVSSLQCLSDITGGTFYHAKGFEGLSGVFESIAAKSVVTQSDVAVESTGLEHVAKAELGSRLSVTVSAELPQDKMYMLTVVPKGSPEKTYTEGVSQVLQLGDIVGSGTKVHSLTLRSAVLDSGIHEVRIVDMLENRIALSTELELFKPGQLSDTESVMIIEKNNSVADAGGSLIVESLDRVAAKRFLEFSVVPAGDIAVINGFYSVQLVAVGTPDGGFPSGSTKTSLVVNGKQKSMKLRAPDAAGKYELRLTKQGQQAPVVRLTVVVY